MRRKLAIIVSVVLLGFVPVGAYCGGQEHVVSEYEVTADEPLDELVDELVDEAESGDVSEALEDLEQALEEIETLAETEPVGGNRDVQEGTREAIESAREALDRAREVQGRQEHRRTEVTEEDGKKTVTTTYTVRSAEGMGGAMGGMGGAMGGIGGGMGGGVRSMRGRRSAATGDVRAFYDIISRNFAYAEEDRERADELEETSDRLAEQYRETEDKAARDKLETELKIVLEDLFDLRTKGYEERVKNIENEMEELRTKVQERQTNKQFIVTTRFKELIGDSDHLRW